MKKTPLEQRGLGPKDICPHHRPVDLSYFAWFDFVVEQNEQGHKQKKCPTCGRYFFPCEMGVREG